MGSLVFVKGQIPPLTDEQKARLAALENMSDEDIDLSDIPEITHEEFKKFKPARLRGSIWKKIRVRTVED